MAKTQTATFVTMYKFRLHMPALLMILAIIAVVSFQGYWLYKNYQEEKQGLRVHTNVLFREAVYLTHAGKIKLDTSIKLKHETRDDIHFLSLGKNRRDSLTRKPVLNSKILIRTKERRPRTVFVDSMEVEIDSGRVRKFIATSPADARTFVEYFETTGSLQDSITIPELTSSYKTMLAREDIDLPFLITKFHGKRREDFALPDLERGNEVTLGVIRPVTFAVYIENATGYIFRKMFPIILVSFLLVALTVLSFILLYRNLLRQRKLTQLKNDFISNITHELKTPIATVSVAIEAMKNFNVLDNPERTEEYLAISTNELQRLSLLVDKVLRLSMFEKKEIHFKKEQFDLSQLVLEVMESMKLQFEKLEAATSLKFSGQNFLIYGDRRHLASVVYNLLDNSLKYSSGNPKIDVELVDKVSFIELRVIDNGVGIPVEYRDKIFEQFFRVPSGDRHNIKGYGLGLSYVSHIVKNHRGFIEVDTALGKGSTFIVRLPIEEAAVIRYDNHRTIRKESFNI